VYNGAWDDASIALHLFCVYMTPSQRP